MTTAAVRAWAERIYVTVMMAVVGRALVATSRVDDEVRGEVSSLSQGYRIRMTVMPAGPSFTVQVAAGGELDLCRNDSDRADLCVRFKHIAHAFLVFSFQEGTARAFANDRMYVDGDISDALRVVRCLSRMEVLILPKWVASHAVKRYPRVDVATKLGLAARIYVRVGALLLKGG